MCTHDIRFFDVGVSHIFVSGNRKVTSVEPTPTETLVK